MPESRRNEYRVPSGPSIIECIENLLMESMRRALAAEETHELLLMRGECQGLAKAISQYRKPFATPQQVLAEFRAKAQGTFVAPEEIRLTTRRYNVDVRVGA